MSKTKFMVIVMAALLVTALAVPVLAASVDVVGITVEGGDAGRFVFDGKDPYQAVLKAGKYLVVDAVSAVNQDVEVIIQSNINAWDQIKATRIGDTNTWYADLSKYNQDHFNDDVEWFKFVVTDFTGDGTFKLNSVEVTDTIPGTEPPSNETPSDNQTQTPTQNNPKTGDENYLFIALILLPVATVGSIYFAKKSHT